MENSKYISYRADRGTYRVRIPHNGKYVYVGDFATIQAAVEARDAKLKLQAAMSEALPVREIAPEVTVRGAIVSRQKRDVQAIWDAVLAAQRGVRQHEAAKLENAIELPNRPVALAVLSDFHIGSAGTDYESLKRDAEIIRDTPDMYAIFHGDGVDNWIIGKLTALQRGQALDGDAEIELFAAWLDMVAEKLLVVVSGNHDLWTKKAAGIDLIAEQIKDLHCLYDKFQVNFTLEHGANKIVFAVRHKWRFNSIFNATHGLQVGWERGDIDFDIAIGGHTHIGTLFHDFFRHQKRRTAILTGAYKRIDSFASEIGFASTASNGCGALVLHPDGRRWSFVSLQEAAAFLKFLQSGGETTWTN